MKNFEENVTKAYKDKVFAAVKPELQKNKAHSPSPYWLWTGSIGTLLVAFFIYFQVLNPVQKHSDLEAALSDNLMMEIAALSAEEVEIVEDLEFMKALDQLSEEELQEIML